ncbi:hypothetical protein GIB67_026552, partial [Kingdonia uniflora]
MVLTLPSDSERQSHVHELELIEVVAYQVAVALSHAAILEESTRARDHLAEKMLPLILQGENQKQQFVHETELTAEQCLMVETVLKSSNLLATLINDVLDLSRLEDRSLELDLRAFNLHSVFREVKDSGSGISPQDVPKLFNKFADSQSLASKNSCGKGLGLAISKRFLSPIEGHIWIESEGLGKGCTATFLVKLGIAEHPKMASKGLVHLGCDLTTAGSSEECISGMDDYEVVSVLQDRFSARHQRPLITALTANIDMATKDNCLRVGMDGVVLKPVSLEKMRSVYRCSCRMALFVKR